MQSKYKIILFLKKKGKHLMFYTITHYIYSSNSIIAILFFIFFLEEYRILGKKGEGTFSEVLKCQSIEDGQYYACKRMKQQFER